MHYAGIDVAVLSWWGQRDHPHSSDTQGVSTDAIMHDVLEAFTASRAEGYPVSVAFHLEPYPGRTIASIREDLRYIADTYGHFPCLHVSNSLTLVLYQPDPGCP